MHPTLRRLFMAAAAGTIISSAAIAAPNVEMQTSMGTIVIELDSEKAPKTVQNFLQYTKDGFYNGTICLLYTSRCV